MTEYTLQAPKPNYIICFHKDNQQVGFFDFNEGAMHFDGNLTESGKIFVDFVLKSFHERIDAAVAAEREECAMLCENEAWRLKKIAVNTGSRSTNTKAIQASNDAAAIRARGYLYEQGQPSAQI